MQRIVAGEQSSRQVEIEETKSDCNSLVCRKGEVHSSVDRLPSYLPGTSPRRSSPLKRNCCASYRWRVASQKNEWRSMQGNL